MKIMLQSRDIKLTAGLQQFITAQAQKLGKLVPQASQITVFLEKFSNKKTDPTANQVKYSINLPGKHKVVVQKHAVDMYHAVVDATESALRQVRKTKEKVLKRIKICH